MTTLSDLAATVDAAIDTLATALEAFEAQADTEDLAARVGNKLRPIGEEFAHKRLSAFNSSIGRHPTDGTLANPFAGALRKYLSQGRSGFERSGQEGETIKIVEGDLESAVLRGYVFADRT